MTGVNSIRWNGWYGVREDRVCFQPAAPVVPFERESHNGSLLHVVVEEAGVWEMYRLLSTASCTSRQSPAASIHLTLEIWPIWPGKQAEPKTTCNLVTCVFVIVEKLVFIVRQQVSSQLNYISATAQVRNAACPSKSKKRLTTLPSLLILMR